MRKIINYAKVALVLDVTIPGDQHRQAWKKLALDNGGTNVYGSDSDFPQNRLITKVEKPIQYWTITFNKSIDGTVSLILTKSIVNGGTITPPTLPVVENHYFDHWDPSDPTDVIATGNATYTAIYNQNTPVVKYTIRFFDEAGLNVLFSYEREYGDAMPNPTVPEKQGWIGEWIPQPMPQTVTKSEDFYAHYVDPDPHTGDPRQYFTTQALEDGTIKFYLSQAAVDNVSVVKYRVGTIDERTGRPIFDDPTWEEFRTQGVPDVINVPVRSGEIVQWRGNGSRYSWGYGNISGDPLQYDYSHFDATCNFKIMNNLLTLLYDTDVESLTKDQLEVLRSSSSYCFGSLFAECNKLINADEISFPRNVVGGLHHFTDMFRECKNLTSAHFRAGEGLMIDSAYERMFLGCEKLVNAPILPSTLLGDYCYQAMFSGCTSLVNAPELPATNLVCSCYDSMFGYYDYAINGSDNPHRFYEGCKNLKNITMRGTYYGPDNEPNSWKKQFEWGSQVYHPLTNWVKFRNDTDTAYTGKTDGHFYGDSGWLNITDTNGGCEYTASSSASYLANMYIGVPYQWSKN